MSTTSKIHLEARSIPQFSNPLIKNPRNFRMVRLPAELLAGKKYESRIKMAQ